jgi:dTDP-4-amino-4,6-dideoxygalactose transaminase
MIKLFDPHVTIEEADAAKDVIFSHNWASGAGVNKVKEFEDKLGRYLGAADTIAVNSGTAALHLALKCLDISKSDIFVPSLTFVSTAHAAMYNEGNPVFIDVNPDTLCMDPIDLERKAKSRRGSVIMPVHFGGMPCEMREILDIAEKHGLKVVDDAAHACGAEYEGKKIGSFGEMTCLSFHPVKNLAMPTGGAIAINDTSRVHEFRKKLNSSRWCGIDNRNGTSYDVTSVAPNYYMSEISAAIGLVQLKKLDSLNLRRREIAKRYFNELKVKEKMPFSKDSAYHLYWILTSKRQELINYLNSVGIEVGTHYRPIHTMTAYRQFADSSLPVTERVGKEIITIPIHPNLTDEDVTTIIDGINRFNDAGIKL